jgi:hypothetical protein
MAKVFNSADLDISRLSWGSPGVPLLPKSLARLWRELGLPEWLRFEASLPEDSTVEALGSPFWTGSSRLSHRVEHYINFLVKTHLPSVRAIKCFDGVWPRGLKVSLLPLSLRSRNLLDSSGFSANPDALMESTFGELLAIPGLGIKSLVEITAVTEAAIDLHALVADELSMTLATEAGDQRGMSSQLDEGWSHVLTETLKEQWVEQISAQDPRFAALLPPRYATLEDQLDRVISDPTAAASEISSLLISLSKIQGLVERMKSQFLEDSLVELLSSVIGPLQPRLAVIADRLGWRGNKPKTLQECGEALGITRERVRQIERRFKEELPNHPVLLTKLDLGISLLEEASPIREAQAAQLLAERGVSRRPFSPVSLLEAAELLGRRTSLFISDVKGQPFVVSADKDIPLSKLIVVARKLAGQAGIASVFQVVDKLTEVKEINKLPDATPVTVTEDDVRNVLGTHMGCEFLDQDWFWFTDIPEGRNRLTNIARRILSVASPQLVSSIREGVRRVFRYRAISTPRYRSLIVPPHSAMANFFKRHPEFRIEDDSVTTLQPDDFRKLLGEGDQIMVDVIRGSSAGVLDRKTLIDACIARGINENTLSVYTSYSPILEHIGLDLWKLRGVQVDPATIEAVRLQNQLRPRETRLLEYGWTKDGKLWVAWRLPSAKAGLVLNVPGGVRRYLSNRVFAAIANDSNRLFGQVSINDSGMSYGYGPIMRYLGADGGDTALAEFDLAKSSVQVSIADSSLLDRD